MADSAAPSLQPVKVEYDPITGVPSEFNQYLPKDSEEYKKWKASQQAGAEGALSDLTLKDKHGEVIEKQLPGGKVKKKAKNEIILETNTRSRKKCVTTILGLETFGVKLPEAAKLFGKKFASGASITKNPMEKDQVEVQGDFVEKAADLIVKTYKDKGIEKKHIFAVVDKKKEPMYDDDEDDEQ
ncbi:g6794 [Coccomyxa viridis]|uniref:G6794 protein n=1 Tax=Coccomyxa viridis TaxID=1274662 RepID=A0ABP1G2U8_9CHLO